MFEPGSKACRPRSVVNIYSMISELSKILRRKFDLWCKIMYSVKSNLLLKPCQKTFWKPGIRHFFKLRGRSSGCRYDYVTLVMYIGSTFGLYQQYFSSNLKRSSKFTKMLVIYRPKLLTSTGHRQKCAYIYKKRPRYLGMYVGVIVDRYKSNSFTLVFKY